MTILSTPRLRLRRAVEGDLDAMHSVLSHPEATRFWSTPPHADLDTTRAWLGGMVRAPSELSEDFVVEMDGRVIGKAGCYRLPEIGYILHPDAWGQGLGREAVAAVIDHVFTTRDLDEVTADVDPRNAASVRLLDRLGFRRTGSAERTYEIAGAWADSLYFALPRADWSASHEG